MPLGRTRSAARFHGSVIPMLSRRTVKLVTLVIAILVFAASVSYIANRFQWREVFTALIKVNFLKLIFLLSLSHFAYIVVRAWRWRSAVRHVIPHIAFWDCYWITAIEVSLSILTPGRVGEAFKIEVMKSRGLLGRLPGFGAFAPERTIDLVMVSSMEAIGLAFGDFATPYPGWKTGRSFLSTLYCLRSVVCYFSIPFGLLSCAAAVRPKCGPNPFGAFANPPTDLARDHRSGAVVYSRRFGW